MLITAKNEERGEVTPLSYLLDHGISYFILSACLIAFSANGSMTL
jgi:hypothetical protein